ncbi:hypothetical protein SpCBS45565_g03865 [Spizellomyces sp. 'palustris']|nr:hypothetical protein SpCBS45565_g03865 [Spizellomyces sp. 'palustris']
MAPQYQDVSLAPVVDSKETMEREIEAYAEHIKNLFADVPALKPKYIPITKETFFSAFQDGILLAHIINEIKAKSVNIQKLNTHINPEHLAPPAKADNVPQEHTKDLFEATNNLNICLDAARNVAVVVNVAAEDFLRKKPDLVLGVVWQLIRAHLLSDVNLPSHPELIRLLEPGESLTTLIGLTNDQVLLRWFNYHLARSGASKRIQNFGKDVTDSEAYLLLLRQVAPGHRKDVTDELEAALKIPAAEKEARAKAVLEAAERLGCRKFVTVADICNSHARLNLAFVATVFAKHIGIHLPTEEQARETLNEVAMLKARIAQLEETVATQANELSAERAAHKANVAALEDKLASETTRLEAALEELRRTKDQDTETYTSQVAELQSRFNALKDEQVRSLESQQAFRKHVGTRLGMVRSMLQDHMVAVKQDSSLAAKLGKLLGSNPNSPERNDTPPPPAATKEPGTMEEELEYLSDDLQAFVKEVLDENREQKKIIWVLATRTEQNEKINSMMGDKIREYTEHQIALNPIKEKKHKEHKEKEHKEKEHKEAKGVKAK